LICFVSASHVITVITRTIRFQLFRSQYIEVLQTSHVRSTTRVYETVMYMLSSNVSMLQTISVLIYHRVYYWMFDLFCNYINVFITLFNVQRLNSLMSVLSEHVKYVIVIHGIYIYCRERNRW